MSRSEEENVYVLSVSSDDPNTGDDINQTYVCRTIEVARCRAIHLISEWAEGEWDNYDEEDVTKLRGLVTSGLLSEAIEHWNGMSTMQLAVKEEEIQDGPAELPNITWPGDDEDEVDPNRPFYVSTYCNYAHYMDDGESASTNHTECWIHPMILRVERDYSVNACYAIEKAFSRELSDSDWDDWDAIVQYLKDNPV